MAERRAKNSTANPLRELLHSCRTRAANKGLDFDLTLEYLQEIDRDECPYFEIPIKFYPRGRGSGKRPIDLKSLDRIDNARGYVKGNVVFCSWGANSLLSHHTAQDLLQIPMLYRVGLNFMRLLNSTKPNETT